MSKEVMQQALEALERMHDAFKYTSHNSDEDAANDLARTTIAALKEAINRPQADAPQQQGEPVAWSLCFPCSVGADVYGKINAMTTYDSEIMANEYADKCAEGQFSSGRPLVVPLYTSAPSIQQGVCYVPTIPAEPAIPEGWQLVPKEPTLHMEAVGFAKRSDPSDKRGSGTSVYKAMLSAAPQYKGETE